jgi:hypothetical protein
MAADESHKKSEPEQAATAESVAIPSPQPSVTSGARDDASPGAAKPEQSQKGDNKARPLAAVAEAVSGKLNKEQIQAVIEKNMDLFGKCATSEALVDVEAIIAPSGSVNDAKAPRSAPANQLMCDCVAAQMKRLSFPRLDGNETAKIAFQLHISKPVSF